MVKKNIALCNKGLNTSEVEVILKLIEVHDVILRKYYSVLPLRKKDKDTFFSWSWFAVKDVLQLLDEYNLPHIHFEETLILSLMPNNKKISHTLNPECV